MEFVNVVVHDFNDFIDFSKEKEISSFIDEVVKDSDTAQDVGKKVDSVAPTEIVAEPNVVTRSRMRQKVFP